MRDSRINRTGAGRLAIAVLVIAVIAVPALLRFASSTAEPATNVIEEITDVSLSDRPGPLADAEGIEAERQSDNQESDAFDYYYYAVPDENLPAGFANADLVVGPALTYIAVAYEVRDDLYVRAMYTYRIQHEDSSSIRFAMSGRRGLGPAADVVPRDEVVAALADAGMTPEGLEQEFHDAVNSMFIAPWSKIYDSDFSANDWGDVELESTGLEE